MSKSGKQWNDYTSSASIDYFFNREPRWRAPVPLTEKVKRHMSPNHEFEALVAGVTQNPTGMLAVPALDGLVSFFRRQRREGLQLSEPLTDSHAPHWCRSAAIAHHFAWKNRERLSLIDYTLEWWGGWLWLCEQLVVPCGPLRGHVVTTGARFKDGDNDERNVILALLDGAKVKKGPDYWTRAEGSPDTFPCLVVRDLVRRGAFASLRAMKPTLSVDLRVERRRDGHVVVARGLKPGEPPSLAVRYGDGVTFTTGDTLNDLGPIEKEASIERAS